MKRPRFHFLLILSCQLIILILFSGCQGETQGHAVTPENILEYAFSLTEDEFFSTFSADRDNAQVQTLGDDTIYELSETSTINGQDASITISFSSGQWRGTIFTILFEGATYLEDVYEFTYEYDTALSEEYGMPSQDYGTPFLEWADTFEHFSAHQYRDSDDLLYWRVGDIYELDDNKVITLNITADESQALLAIEIYEYTYRPINQSES